MALVVACCSRAAWIAIAVWQPLAMSNNADLDGWKFFPLKKNIGEVRVTCGGGSMVEWFVQVGDYVRKDDPVCETCPKLGGRSMTCKSPASGYISSEQPLSAGDDIDSNIPDGVVALVAQTRKECQDVLCENATTFGQFVESKGSFLEQNAIVALAFTDSGMVTHCRAPRSGTLTSMEHLHQGEHMTAAVAVACLRAEPAQARAGLHASSLAGHKHLACPTVAHGTQDLSPFHIHDRDSSSLPRKVTSDAVASNATQPIAIIRKLPPASVSKQKMASLSTRARSAAFLSVAASQKDGLLARVCAASRLQVLVWCCLAILLLSLVVAFIAFPHGRFQYMPLRDCVNEAPKEDLRMVFMDQSGNEKVFNFEYRPLGIAFTEDTPIKVRSFEFNSYAKAAGVEVGWVLTQIGEEVVPRSDCFNDVRSYLEDQVNSLAMWPVTIKFEADGEVKSICFYRKPLGIELTRSAPFRVKAFALDSYAKDCGVELGWSILQVGSLEVQFYTTLPLLTSYVDNVISHLPQVPEGLKAVFVDEAGVDQVCYFKRKPFGVNLSARIPGKVESFQFNSYAPERGVKVGWTLREIAGQIVSDSMSSDCVCKLLTAAEASADLSTWPLRVDFDTGDGEGKSIFFEQQPLGMELREGYPSRVESLAAEGMAQRQGVETGWIISRIGTVDVAMDTPFETLIGYLVDGARGLPRLESSKPVRGQ